MSDAQVLELEQLSARFQQNFERSREVPLLKTLLSSTSGPAHRLNVQPGVQLMYIDTNGLPTYNGTDNFDAAGTISTYDVWPLPLGGGFVGLDGATTQVRTLGIWDVGAVLRKHQEFGNRVIQVDHQSVTSDHSTHVAGTMVSAGQFNNLATGMSYKAPLAAYDWTDDKAEMAAAGALGMRISNHSYGFLVGWYEPIIHDDPMQEPGPASTWYWYGDLNVNPVEDWRFGFYTAEAADWDQIAAAAPNYLIVKSAGNDRVDTGPGPGGGHFHWDSTQQAWVFDTDFHESDGGTTLFDTLPPRGTAKNVLTVGAVFSAPAGYAGPSSVVMTGFSGWGPTDDGRIKPDLVADGTYVLSTSDASKTAYTTKSGTSMAAPSVSGSANLIVEQYIDTKDGRIPLSSTVKALLIQTADEAGPNPGPDYMYGWGQMNTYSAVQLLDQDVWDAGHVREGTLTNGAVDDYYVLHDGASALRITLVWTDPAGTPPAVSTDPVQPMLVHDLDLRATHVDFGTIEFPWLLDPANPTLAATTGDNTLDNVEQIELAPGGGGAKKATIGFYRISVSHKGTLQSPQRYSLVAGSALKDCLPGFADITPPAMNMNGLSDGTAWGDYDGDGDDDLYIAQGTWPGPAPNKLFRNDGNGSFTEATPTALQDPGAGRGVAWADYDNDGDLDLYVVNYFGANKLYRNDGGGTFSDQTTTVSQGGAGNHLGVAWGDYNNDGRVDLYLCVQGNNQLLRNDGGGVFTDVTVAPLDDALLTSAAVWGDYDSDGDQDLYLSNVGANKLLRNDGSGVFTDVTSGPLGNTGTGHGVAWGDYDNDGDLDLYVANNFEPNKLLRNDGSGVFTDVTGGLLAGPQYAIVTDWVDFDNDGDLDLFVGAQFGDNNTLYRNEGGGIFVNFTYPVLQMPSLDSGGLGIEDFDGDGDLDFILSHTNGNNALMRDDLCSVNRWLKVKLIGSPSNRAGIGARVEVSAAGRTQIREISGGAGKNQPSLTAEFGLGTAGAADQIVVRWPSGTVQTVTGPVVTNQTVNITEGGVVTDAQEPVPSRNGILRAVSNSPNPFNPATTIHFELTSAAQVTIDIFDAAGRKVRRLVDGRTLGAGPQVVRWSGDDESGRLVASGIYFYRVRAGDAERVEKMAVLK